MWKGGYFAGCFGYSSPCRRYWRLRMARRSLFIFNCSDGFVVSTAMEDRMSMCVPIDSSSFARQLPRNPRAALLTQWYGLQDYPSRIVFRRLICFLVRIHHSGSWAKTWNRTWSIFANEICTGAQGILYRSCVFERNQLQVPVRTCQSMWEYKKPIFFSELLDLYVGWLKLKVKLMIRGVVI